MRFHRPVGILLLLWPTLWALWIASSGAPSFSILSIFIVGTCIMRAAGCVINDYADRHFDGKVTRTQNRPLVLRTVTEKEALVLFISLSGLALTLLLFLNPFTRLLAVVGFLLTLIYPFTKRFFFAPQIVLGLSFSWGIPMAFTAVLHRFPLSAFLLYVATFLWIVAYDTEYAMVDRTDDLKLPIHSTAILFGRYDKPILAWLQLGFLVDLFSLGKCLHYGLWYNLSLSLAACLFFYQHQLIRYRLSQKTLQAFTNNGWVGGFIFLGIAAEHYF